jgi:aryl-alcohol dehydrogenase-like predicted oxidoreductase
MGAWPGDEIGAAEELRLASLREDGRLRPYVNTESDSTDMRGTTFPRFTPENRKANRAVVDLLTRIAAHKRATPAQIALAWLLYQNPWIVPIPGTTKLHRLEENLGAASVELTPDDLLEIEESAAMITGRGDRYPAHLQQRVGR